MIGPCPSTIASDALLRDVLTGADCLIATQVEQGYAALLAPGGSFATALIIALTIYVAIFGYRLILGQSSLTLGEVVPHFIKIGIVVALASSWPSYQALVFDVLFDGPQQLADLIVAQAGGPAGKGEVLLALQAVFDRLTDAASDAWAQVVPPATATAAPLAPTALPPGVPPPPPPAVQPVQVALPFALGAPQFVAAILWLAALILVAASVGVLLVVRIVLALLLLLGPVFVAFALFRGTRGVAEGWLRVTVRFALVPLFTLPLIAVVVAVLAPLTADLDTPVDGVRDHPALLILLVVAVFAAVMTQAAKLGGAIASGIRLPRGRATPPAPERSTTTTAGETMLNVTPSRAQTIVEAIDAGQRRTAAGSVGTTPAAIVATRTITGPAIETRVADTASRLGQGYRRLAVAQPARPRT